MSTPFDGLLKALTASRAADNCAPGIMLSWLADQNCYYASVHVFDGGRRKIACKATGATVAEAVEAVVNEYEKL